jgi:hypothetical protein
MLTKETLIWCLKTEVFKPYDQQKQERNKLSLELHRVSQHDQNQTP